MPKPDWQTHPSLYLNDNQIETIPANLNLPRLSELWLNENLITAIPANLNLHRLETLYLSNNRVETISANINLPELRRLVLINNHIEDEGIDTEIFQRLPHLWYINLNKNPLTQEKVNQLRAAAAQTGRDITIIADDIGEQYLRAGINIKGAKR